MFAHRSLARPAVLALAAFWPAAHASPAGAAFLTFTGQPQDANAFVFAGNGGLSGHLAINNVAVLAPDTGPAFAIANGVLDFQLGTVSGGNAASGYTFNFGGSLTLTGSFNGGAQETIFSTGPNMNGGFLTNTGGNRYQFSLGTIGLFGTLATDVGAAYGIAGTARVNTGSFLVAFVGTPGGSTDAGGVGNLRFAFAPAAVPEPASVGLVLVGGGLVVGWRVTRCRRAAG